MFVAALAAAPVKAAIVTLTITGDYNNLTFNNVSDFAGWSTSGLTSIPFSYSLTYDTSLNAPNATVATAGSVVGPYGYIVAHDLYGYTSAGLLSLNKTLGTLSWSTANLSQAIPFTGAVGDLWFDADISVAAPTRAWVVFQNSGRYFSTIGQAMLGSGNTLTLNYDTYIQKAGGITYENVQTTLPFTITSSIPEPSILSLMMLGLGVLYRGSRKRI